MSHFPLIIGFVFVLFGISIFLKPLIKIVVTIFLIYLGISVITDLHIKDQHTTFFNHQIIEPYNISPSSYQTILGESVIDFTHLSYGKKPLTFNISTILGKTTMYIPRNIPTNIIAHASCADISLPDSSSGIFGTKTYNSHQGNPGLILHVRSTLGQVIVKEK